MREKAKLLVVSNFSYSQCFFGKLSAIFILNLKFSSTNHYSVAVSKICPLERVKKNQDDILIDKILGYYNFLEMHLSYLLIYYPLSSSPIYPSTNSWFLPLQARRLLQILWEKEKSLCYCPKNKITRS